MSEDIERAGIQRAGKRIVNQKRRHQQQPRVAHIAEPVALQRAQVVRVAQLGAQLLEDRPVPVPAFNTELAREMIPEIVLHKIIVEQRIVAVEEEYDIIRGSHVVASTAPTPWPASARSNNEWTASSHPAPTQGSLLMPTIRRFSSRGNAMETFKWVPSARVSVGVPRTP